MTFLAIKPTSVTGIVPKAKKYVFFPIDIIPIFKVEEHIIALASRKATYSKFKFDIMIFVHGSGA